MTGAMSTHWALSSRSQSQRSGRIRIHPTDRCQVKLQPSFLERRSECRKRKLFPRVILVPLIRASPDCTRLLRSGHPLSKGPYLQLDSVRLLRAVGHQAVAALRSRSPFFVILDESVPASPVPPPSPSLMRSNLNRKCRG